MVLKFIFNVFLFQKKNIFYSNDFREKVLTLQRRRRICSTLKCAERDED